MSGARKVSRKYETIPVTWHSRMSRGCSGIHGNDPDRRSSSPAETALRHSRGRWHYSGPDFVPGLDSSGPNCRRSVADLTACVAVLSSLRHSGPAHKRSAGTAPTIPLAITLAAHHARGTAIPDPAVTGAVAALLILILILILISILAIRRLAISSAAIAIFPPYQSPLVRGEAQRTRRRSTPTTHREQFSGRKRWHCGWGLPLSSARYSASIAKSVANPAA